MNIQQACRQIIFALCTFFFLVANGMAESNYDIEVLVAAPPLRGANGMAFDADGNLYAGSIISNSIYKVDIETGAVEIIIGPPQGTADDIAFGPDGTMAWTAIDEGIVRAMMPDGEIKDLASGLFMINSLNFTKDGRLFAATVTPGVGNLYEIDLTGETPARIVMKGLKRLNSFEITDDNILIGPLMTPGKIVAIDLNTETMTDIADGFAHPTAVNLDSKGNIFVVDWDTGELVRIDAVTREKSLIATVEPPIDNLAISADDRIFVSHLCQNGIEEIDPNTGAVRLVTPGVIGIPAGLGIIEHDGIEMLFATGMFCENFIDTKTGDLTRLPRGGDNIWSSSFASNGKIIALASFAFGVIQIVYPGTDQKPEMLRGFRSPYDIEFLADDSLLVAEQGTGRLLRIAAPYSAKGETIAEGLGGPLGMALLNNETVYVTESTDGEISKVNLTDGTHIVVKDGLKEPEGIAIMADGRLAVAEVGAKRLIAVDPQTGEVEIIAADLAIGVKSGPPWPETYVPTGVVVDSEGAIYLSSDIDNTILKITRR